MQLLQAAGSGMNLDIKDVITYIQGFRATSTSTTSGLPSTSQLTDGSCAVVLKTFDELIAVSQGKPQKEVSVLDTIQKRSMTK